MAVTTLERGCPADDLRASVASSACDFRAMWAALRILQRKQNQQGALPFAEAARAVERIKSLDSRIVCFQRVVREGCFPRGKNRL